jgi:hypothetical protein
MSKYTMSKNTIQRLILLAAAVLTSSAAFGQFEIQLHVRQQPGWDARAREGHCEIRVWVDNRAEVRMRGDSLFVRTVEGSKGRDEGSACSQPLPYNSVRDFQVRQTAGRSRVTVAQEPGRANNYTALIAIEDRQGGGDNYAFEVSWRADGDVTNAPAAFFDDVRACQAVVRKRFMSQNGRGSYIDFDEFADRQGQNQNQNRGKARNRGQESIQGRGNARTISESRNLTYSCVMDSRKNQIISGVYSYTGDALRTDARRNDRRDDRRQLR